jgi:hypothetical protein
MTLDWQIDRGDVLTSEDFEDFVRATVLFESWRPDLEIVQIRVALKRAHPLRPTHRCLIEVALPCGTWVGGTVGLDPWDTVQRAAIAVAAILPDERADVWTDLVVPGHGAGTPGEARTAAI